MEPILSAHFQTRTPSAVRLSQIEFLKRTDQVVAVNAAIGNVSLPTHPAMMKRMFSLDAETSPFKDGVIKYSTTVGEKETNRAFLHLIESSGFSTQGLHSQITDGGSQAMELAILGVCGPAGSDKKPLLMIDPTYSNYSSFAERTGRSTISVTRHLEESGIFSLPKLEEIEKVIKEKSPGALLVIPYDNPTGQFYPQSTLNELGKLCVKHNMWLVSDEAYRELFYTKEKASSIWGITEHEVPGITGRRISIESASKIWNACGLRIGALITDNKDFHTQAVAESTANLCANTIGQYIFGSLSHISKEEIQDWFTKQRAYYQRVASHVTSELKALMPELIISKPDASLYTVIDVRNALGKNFQASDFIMYCAQRGRVNLRGVQTTLLTAPMSGFYCMETEQPNPGKTQMRIAYVEPERVLADIPLLLTELLKYFSKTLS